MKVLWVVFVIAAAIYPAVAQDTPPKKAKQGGTCGLKGVKIDDKWIDMKSACTQAMKDQIQEELKASMEYLAMGAHFSLYNINRPGFAEFYFKAASEEREHALKLISYLLMRGKLTEDLSTLIAEYYPPKRTSFKDAIDALKYALALETEVTNKIRGVIKVCEGENDQNEDYNHYHLVDYLTGDFLEEQYHGQREIAGMISTLGKMMKEHGKLGEFLYDKKLME